MPKFMISFNDGDMRFPREDLPAVADAAHSVMREAKAAGVWVFGGGFMGDGRSVVGLDGVVTPGHLAASDVRIGGFCVVDVPSREEAVVWAHKTAVACRCAQEMREFMDDPEA